MTSIERLQTALEDLERNKLSMNHSVYESLRLLICLEIQRTPAMSAGFDLNAGAPTYTTRTPFVFHDEQARSPLKPEPSND